MREREEEKEKEKKTVVLRCLMVDDAWVDAIMRTTSKCADAMCIYVLCFRLNYISNSILLRSFISFFCIFQLVSNASVRLLPSLRRFDFNFYDFSLLVITFAHIILFPPRIIYVWSSFLVCVFPSGRQFFFLAFE